MDWTAAMLTALDDFTPDSIAKAQRLKDQHLPDRIYRYRQCNTFSLYNLSTNTQWSLGPMA